MVLGDEDDDRWNDSLFLISFRCCGRATRSSFSSSSSSFQPVRDVFSLINFVVGESFAVSFELSIADSILGTRIFLFKSRGDDGSTCSNNGDGGDVLL